MLYIGPHQHYTRQPHAQTTTPRPVAQPPAVGLLVAQSIESALIQQPNLDQIGQLSVKL